MSTEVSNMVDSVNATPLSLPSNDEAVSVGLKLGTRGHVYDDVYHNIVGQHEIRNVWATNLVEEIQIMEELVDDYQYIAMDTEFPGTVAKPRVDRSDKDYQYKSLKCNVDLLKIIQLGVTLCDESGKLPPRTWQFNFHFDLDQDMYAQDSIDFLKISGIDFPRHGSEGIDVNEFAETVMMSGLVLSEKLTWITFHSGYDYGYLLKVLTDQPLPDLEVDFFTLLETFFPRIYDIKYMMKSCEDLKGGLNQLASDLKVERIGVAHQAGSDSLLTAATFFKLKARYFENDVDENKFLGILYGLGRQLKPKRSTRKKLNF